MANGDKNKMIYITGDTHGVFRRIENFCRLHKTTTDDIMIILGDAGINYHGGENDNKLKKHLSKIPVTFFCIHGNHEMRPQNVSSYKEMEWRGGTVFIEDKFPTLLFAKDGEIFNFNGNKCIAIGGAYSVDKYFRFINGGNWWDDEQPSEAIKKSVEEKFSLLDYKIDTVLSHTCPYKYIPTEMFLSGIDQSTVDTSTEQWLDTIENTLDYKVWYCGHYHTDKDIDKIKFFYFDIEPLVCFTDTKDGGDN